MKKLQKLVLHKTAPLTIPQMKRITGGYEGGGNDGYDTGTCGWGLISAGGTPFRECGISKDEAKKLFNTLGGNWCCDSCSTTWYCGPGSEMYDLY